MVISVGRISGTKAAYVGGHDAGYSRSGRGPLMPPEATSWSAHHGISQQRPSANERVASPSCDAPFSRSAWGLSESFGAFIVANVGSLLASCDPNSKVTSPMSFKPQAVFSF
ncbi:hypothetical protein AOLI_G00066280 [Acnodon oligacanthus]